MAIDLDVHIPIVLTVPQPYEKVTADVGEDAEFEVLAEMDQGYPPIDELPGKEADSPGDRKSTRLNSSHT